MEVSKRVGSPEVTLDGGTGGAQNSRGSPLTRQEFRAELRKTCVALRAEIVNDIQKLLENKVVPGMKEFIDGARPPPGVKTMGRRRSFDKYLSFPTFSDKQTSQEGSAKDSELRVQGDIKDVAAMPGVVRETLVSKDGTDEFPQNSEDVVEAGENKDIGSDSAPERKDSNESNESIRELPCVSLGFERCVSLGSESSQLNNGRKQSWQAKTPTMQSRIKEHTRTSAFYNQITALDSFEEGGRVYRLVSSDYFDYGMGAILVLNALAIGVQVDVMARSASTEPIPAFGIIDLLFCIVFTIELALRLCAFGCKKFLTMKDWRWNLFDLLIVSFGLMDEITKLVLSGTEVQEVIDSLGVLRMLRLGRILRLVRMVRLIPALKSMVYLIAASMLSFFWTGVLLIIFMYCVAVYFTELCTEFVHKQTSDDTSNDFSELKEQWGSVGLSVMSLFQAITGGDDWKNLVSGFKASESTYSVNVVILSLYIAFAMLVMLNLVTGVFVEGAQKITGEEKEAELVRTVRRLVAALDGDGNGEISWEEFEEHLEDEMMQDFLKGFDMNSTHARDIFHVLDTDGSGGITMDEFITATVSLRGPTKMADTEVLKYGIAQSFGEVNRRLDTFVEMLANIPRLQEQQSSPAPFSDAAATQAPLIHAPIIHSPSPQCLVSASTLPYPRLFFVGTTEMEV